MGITSKINTINYNKFKMTINRVTLFVQITVFILMSSICCSCRDLSNNANNGYKNKVTAKNQFIKISDKNSLYLSYTDGTPYIPLGPNICWPRFETSEEEGLAKMQFYFKKLEENNCNYTRIWLSAPFFNIEENTAGKYDSTIVRRIDTVLSMASNAGVKVKFCIENFRVLTNRPSPFPGSVPFDKPIYSENNGGPISDITNYFTSVTGRNLFLKKMRFYSKKYGNNPTILGWELWNEINAVDVEESLLLSWTTDMLHSAKEIFPNHLVMQSLGSFSSNNIRKVYRDYSLLNNNELAQIHRYLDPGANLEVCKGSMDILAFDAIKELKSYNLVKPLLLSEVGAVEANHAGPSKLYESDTLGILLHDMLFAPYFSGSAGPGQSWHWHYYIEKNDLWWHFNRFYEATKNTNPITESFFPKYFETKKLRVYALIGKETTLVWLRDSKSNWQTELIDKIYPESFTDSISMKKLGLEKMEINSIKFYNPWSNTWSMGQVKNNLIHTPIFSRSLMLKIRH